MLVEFVSVVDEVRCMVAVPQAMPEQNMGVAAASRIELCIGINLGDVIVEGDDLYGDGVNIAAWVEALADAGGVFVPNTVHDHARDRLPLFLRIWASSKSRTLPGQCGSIGCVTLAPPLKVHRRQPNQWRRFPTSGRSRCCPSRI
jgi:class 3 adenylate cyclase